MVVASEEKWFEEVKALTLPTVVVGEGEMLSREEESEEVVVMEWYPVSPSSSYNWWTFPSKSLPDSNSPLTCLS